MSLIDLFFVLLIPANGALFVYWFAEISLSSAFMWFIAGWVVMYIVLAYGFPLLLDLLDKFVPIRPNCIQCGSRGKNFRGSISIWSEICQNTANDNEPTINIDLIGRFYHCPCGKKYFHNYLDNKFCIVVSGDIQNSHIVEPWKHLKFNLFWEHDPSDSLTIPHQMNVPLLSIKITENSKLTHSYTENNKPVDKCLLGSDHYLPVIIGAESVKDLGWIVSLTPPCVRLVVAHNLYYYKNRWVGMECKDDQI